MDSSATTVTKTVTSTGGGGGDTVPKGVDLSSKHKLEWTTAIEELLASWGDIASCYKWMHEQSFRKYYRINYFMSIPIIILSTVTGTLSVGMSGLVSPEYINMASQIVGGVNIFTGIITTLQNFFHFAQLSEGHQHSGVGWNKLERNIRIELKIERYCRKDADSFIKVCRSEYDRLLEQSPIIPKDIIKMFRTTFKNQTSLIKPDICDVLEHTDIAKVVVDVAPEELVDEDLQQQNKTVLEEIKQMLSESKIAQTPPFSRRESFSWKKPMDYPNIPLPMPPQITLPRTSTYVPHAQVEIHKSSSVQELRKKFGGTTSRVVQMTSPQPLQTVASVINTLQAINGIVEPRASIIADPQPIADPLPIAADPQPIAADPQPIAADPQPIADPLPIADTLPIAADPQPLQDVRPNVNFNI